MIGYSRARSPGSTDLTTTARLRIEELLPGHAAVLFSHLQAPGLYIYIDEEPPASLEALTARHQRWQAGSGEASEVWKNWVLFDDADGAPVGTLQATIYGAARAQIAYLVFPPHWRRGYAGEALTWLLGELRAGGVSVAEALVDDRNEASIALLRSLGFALAETIEGAATIRGRPSDEHRFELSL